MKRLLFLGLSALMAWNAAAQVRGSDTLTVSLEFDIDSATNYPERRVYDMPVNKDSVFLVISKIHQEHLCVYEKRHRDTVLLAAYPCAVSRNLGQKISQGDCRTPESWPRKPFRIFSISDFRKVNEYSTKYRIYGPYYHALATPGWSGIGIHGTNSPTSIGRGRVSHGCIRLLNKDIAHLRENYTQVGMQVIILPEKKQPLPFEVRALEVVCGLHDPGPDMGCSIDCHRVNRPCTLIHINPQFNLRKTKLEL